MADAARSEALMIREVDDWWLSQVTGWTGSMEQLEAHLARSLDCALPARVGETAPFGAGMVLRVAPERFWILWDGHRLDGEALSAIDPAAGATVRLDHGRTRLRLSGTDGIGILSRSIALDCQAPSLAPGRFAQTMLHRVPVLLLRQAFDAFDLFVPQSFARSVREWLDDAAQGASGQARRAAQEGCWPELDQGSA